MRRGFATHRRARSAMGCSRSQVSGRDRLGTGRTSPGFARPDSAEHPLPVPAPRRRRALSRPRGQGRRWTRASDSWRVELPWRSGSLPSGAATMWRRSTDHTYIFLQSHARTSLGRCPSGKQRRTRQPSRQSRRVRRRKQAAGDDRQQRLVVVARCPLRQAQEDQRDDCCDRRSSGEVLRRDTALLHDLPHRCPRSSCVARTRSDGSTARSERGGPGRARAPPHQHL